MKNRSKSRAFFVSLTAFSLVFAQGQWLLAPLPTAEAANIKPASAESLAEANGMQILQPGETAVLQNPNSISSGNLSHSITLSDGQELSLNGSGEINLIEAK